MPFPGVYVSLGEGPLPEPSAPASGLTSWVRSRASGQRRGLELRCCEAECLSRFTRVPTITLPLAGGSDAKSGEGIIPRYTNPLRALEPDSPKGECLCAVSKPSGSAIAACSTSVLPLSDNRTRSIFKGPDASAYGSQTKKRLVHLLHQPFDSCIDCRWYALPRAADVVDTELIGVTWPRGCCVKAAGACCARLRCTATKLMVNRVVQVLADTPRKGLSHVCGRWHDQRKRLAVLLVVVRPVPRTMLCHVVCPNVTQRRMVG